MGEQGISPSAYEGDIVSRLLGWRELRLARGGELFEEAAGEILNMRGDAEIARLRLDAANDEIARLQSALAGYTSGISASGGSKFALTAEERAAVLDAALAYEGDPDELECAKIAAALRGLLERLSLSAT